MRRNPTEGASFGPLLSLLLLAGTCTPLALPAQAPQPVAGRLPTAEVIGDDCASCRAQGSHPWSRTFGDPLLQHIYEELARNSPTFREAMESLALRGFVVRIADLTELTELNENRPPTLQIWPSPQAVGAAVYSPDDNGRVNTVLVVVDVHRLHELTRAGPRAPVDSVQARAYLRDALIHELYGHVVPLGLVGHVRAAVRDPKPGEPFARSPVGIRENRIRRELGLPPRSAYALDA